MSNTKIKNTMAKDRLVKGGFSNNWEFLMVQLGVHIESLSNGIEINELKQIEAQNAQDLLKTLDLNQYLVMYQVAKTKADDHILLTNLLGNKPQRN
jgi:hypothetical protein